MFTCPVSVFLSAPTPHPPTPPPPSFFFSFFLLFVALRHIGSKLPIRVNGTRFYIGNERFFLSGANTAWVNYAADFGNNQYSHSRQIFLQLLSNVSDAGGNSMSMRIQTTLGNSMSMRIQTTLGNSMSMRIQTTIGNLMSMRIQTTIGNLMSMRIQTTIGNLMSMRIQTALFLLPLFFSPADIFIFMKTHSLQLFRLFCFNTSLSLAGNSSRLIWVRHSNRKTNVSHSHLCVQYLCASTL